MKNSNRSHCETDSLPTTLNEVQLIYSRPPTTEMPKIQNSEDGARLLRTVYPKSQMDHREMMYALFLNRANYVLGVSPISQGGLSGTVADVRIIMQLALKMNATSFILSHNHPSGNLSPSASDQTVTRKIKQAAELLDLKLLDHLILTSEGYFSFADEGLL